MFKWVKGKSIPYEELYAHGHYGVDLVKYYQEHSPTLVDKAHRLNEWMGNVLGTNSVGMNTHTPIMKCVEPGFKIVHAQLEFRHERVGNRPGVALVLQLTGKNIHVPSTRKIDVDRLSIYDFQLINNNVIADHEQQWGAFIEALTEWSSVGDGLPLPDRRELWYFPDAEEDRLMVYSENDSVAFSTNTELDQYRAAEYLNGIYTAGLREVVSLVRKCQKHLAHCEQTRKGSAKGCKFEVGDFVRRVPKDLRKVFESAETWDCFKVHSHVTPEQQTLFLSEEPSYPPDMVLITPDYKRFLAFSGDYVASVRKQPQTHKRRGAR